MPGQTSPPQVDLRSWCPDDLELLHRLLGDPLMMDHLGGIETPAQIQDRHQRYLKTGTPDRSQMFVIVVGPDHAAAGAAGYWERRWKHRRVWETAYSVLPEHQGRGIATRATLLVAENARREALHRYMHAFPTVDNLASNAVCRKAGFVLQGDVDFEYPKGHQIHCNDWRLDLSQDSHLPRAVSLEEGPISPCHRT